MSRQLMRAVVLAALTLSAVRLLAQNCNGTLAVLNVSSSCGTLASPCPLSGTTFTVYDVNTGLPYVPTPCDRSITWTFGDGGATASGVSAQHTWSAAGQYYVHATLSSSIYDAPRTFGYGYFWVAGGGMSATPAKTSVFENEGAAIINVHTTYSPTAVTYSAYDAGNAAGRFAPVTGTLSFAAGEYDKSFSIPLIDDTQYTGSGVIGFQLSNPTTDLFVVNGSYLMSPTMSGSVNLQDNESPPTISFSATKYTFSEAAGTAVLTVNRTGDLTRTVSVGYSLSGSTAYPTGTLTFGPNETTKTISMPIPNDNLWEPDRTWGAQIARPTNGAVLGNPSCQSCDYQNVPIVITEDEPIPSLSVSDATVVEGDQGFRSVNVTVTLSPAINTTGVVMVPLTYGGTATRDVDYVPQVSYVGFNGGVTSATVPISIAGDTLIEPDETITVTLGTPSWAGSTPIPNVPTIAKGTGTITIVNDDLGMTWLTLDAGTTGGMTIYLGNPTPVRDAVTLTSSNPDVVKVPPSFVAESGRRTLGFTVEALSQGESLITAKFPASLGGGHIDGTRRCESASRRRRCRPDSSRPASRAGHRRVASDALRLELRTLLYCDVWRSSGQ